jgi:hypothetical protein
VQNAAIASDIIAFEVMSDGLKPILVDIIFLIAPYIPATNDYNIIH